MRGIKLWLLLMGLLCSVTAGAQVHLLAWQRPPLSSLDETGVPQGLVIELAQMMFARAAVDYRLDFVPFQRALYQAAREPDSCMLLVERRQEEESSYAWVGPLLISRVGLYAMPGNPPQLSSLAELGKMPVISHQGSAASEYLKRLGVIVEQASKESLGLAMLNRGRAPLWATSPVVLRSVVAAGDPQPVEVLPILTLMEDMACNPQMDQAVLDSLRNALSWLYAQGAVHQLYQRYGVELD